MIWPVVVSSQQPNGFIHQFSLWIRRRQRYVNSLDIIITLWILIVNGNVNGVILYKNCHCEANEVKWYGHVVVVIVMTTTATVAMDSVAMAAAPVPDPDPTIFIDMGSLNVNIFAATFLVVNDSCISPTWLFTDSGWQQSQYLHGRRSRDHPSVRGHRSQTRHQSLALNILNFTSLVITKPQQSASHYCALDILHILQCSSIAAWSAGKPRQWHSVSPVGHSSTP